MRAIILFLLFYCYVNYNTLYAQSHNFQNYSTEDGLPQSQVLGIYQDEKGYLWFGTNSGGVSKFDGKHFFNLNTNDGLANNVVYSISGNGNGELYFGTGKGLSVYSNKTFTNYNEKNGLLSTFIFHTKFYNNKLYIATSRGVFIYESGSIKELKGDSILENSSVYRIYIDGKQNIWFATIQNGAIKFNLPQNKYSHYSTANGLTNDYVFSINETEKGEILIGTQTGLNKIDTNDKISSVQEFNKNMNVSFTCIEKAKDNLLYFGSFGEGLIKADFKNNIISSYRASKGFTNSHVLDLLLDREQNLWIATNGSGVYKYSGKKFTYMSKNDGLPANYITSVCIDKDKNTWLAITGFGAVRIKNEQIEVFKNDFKTSVGPVDNNINSIICTKAGRLYFGTEEGLCYFENEKFITIENNLIRRKYIYSLYEDKNGIVYIGTTNGLYKLQNENIEECHDVNKLCPVGEELSIYCIREDNKGNLWFATDFGVIKKDAASLTYYNKLNGFITGRINAIVGDKYNNVWLGTEKGLYHFSNQSFNLIGKGYHVTSSNICLLAIDRQNKLFIGGNSNIGILDLNKYYKGELHLKQIVKEEGLLSKESNANAIAIDESNRIFIGTINGLQIYDPVHDFINQLEPKVHVVNVELSFGLDDIQKYCEGFDSINHLPKNLVLPYDKNNLNFKYDGVSLTVPEKVRYKYQLAGLEKSWSPEIGTTEITYPSLPPGTYTFCVKAMNNDGVWNETPATFAFEILPPWYKTWWFYSLSVILVLVGIAAYNAYKTNALKKSNIKLEKTVLIRTKELREEKEKVENINKEVILQKQEIEHKNTEITDSIKYAKNIQEALLPSIIKAEQSFNDAFIFYQPKDIVSGDFFWFYETDEIKYIAAADCTGHGVPGAFMSIVGNTILNEILHAKLAVSPGDILLELHKGVKQALSSNERESQRRDGMDIALCAIHKKSAKVEFAGANRPLWLYRKKENYKVEVIKPTKYPIGGLELEESRLYANHVIDVEKGDKFFIFSDGFADQFGGPRGKKLMVANMHKLISEIINQNSAQQKLVLKNTFEEWKGNHEQVDDVLVIGVCL
ncbi:MAG: SpoIIE family protein phosphatase [Sphingobacteriaceae bacterium]|nr:SpoIIE family protein phosphatase [Sphingobacteriaceae bacterium]